MATYIIQAGDSGPVKIGRTDDVNARIADLQTSHHELLRLLRVIDTAFDAEPLFHKRFAHLRLRGEWFTFDAEMLTFVPAEPKADEDAPLADIIKTAWRRAVVEAQDLCEQIWQHFKGIDTRRQFVKRLAKLIGFRPSQSKKLIYGERSGIEVHEMEGLKALARKLRRSDERANSMPLFEGLKDEGKNGA